jgi:hypothetical protein
MIPKPINTIWTWRRERRKKHLHFTKRMRIRYRQHYYHLYVKSRLDRWLARIGLFRLAFKKCEICGGYYPKTNGYFPVNDWGLSALCHYCHEAPNYAALSISRSTIKEEGEYIYFILNPRANMVKIGYSNNPERRLKALQVANCVPLRMLGYVEGNIYGERNLHALLKLYHTNGEWFRYTKEVRDVIRTAMKAPHKLGVQGLG